MTTLNKYINKPTVTKKAHILGFTGCRKMGKTFASNILMTLDQRFHKLSFAEALKRAYAEHADIPFSDLEDVGLKEKHRRALQIYSTEMKKEHGEFIFVQKLLEQVEDSKYYVIDDVRFLCELQAIFMYGGVIYKVYADNAQRSQRGWYYDPKVDEDVSETELGTLSGDIFYSLCKGGLIFNTKDDHYLQSQLQEIIQIHFPMSTPELYEKLNKLKELDL